MHQSDSRRKIRTRGLVLLAVGLIFCAVFASRARAVEPEGELRIAVSAMENESLDPANGSGANNLWNQLIYDQFIGLDPHAKIDLGRGICRSYEQSADGLTWTFHLRRGIRFHTGDELTAEDVKFCWERAQEPWVVGLAGATLRKVADHIDVADRYTVVVHLKKPYLFLWSILSGNYPIGYIYPKKYVQDKGDQYFRQHPVGTGPYRLVRHEQGVSMEFEAVPGKHWRWGTPKYKKIIFKIVPEAKTRMALLRTGEVDIAPLPRDWAVKLKKEGHEVVMLPSQASVFVGYHSQWRRDNPLSREKVREALDLAINRQEIIDYVLAGFAVQTGIPAPWAAISAYMEPNMVKPYPYDPARAKTLLKEAGYPNGFDIKMVSWPKQGMAEGPKIIEAIAGYWSAIGVRPKIVPIDYGTWRKQWVENPDQGCVVGWYWVGSRIWPMSIVRALFASDGKLTYAKDPEVDRMINLVASAPDEKALKKSLWGLATYMFDHHISGTLFESAVPFGVSKKASGWFPGLLPYAWNFQQLFASRHE
ncbi:MAG: ABC transporter substrate-binding protein [Deltaproteobacteria bacterium]|nr:ABC transporter substrate-binding protein [Deltaproteobacteria bacterium]